MAYEWGKHDRTLRKVNNLLTLVVILINVYVFCAPLVPRVELWWKLSHQKNGGAVYGGALAEAVSVSDAPVVTLPDDSRVVIPAIALDEHIFEGTDPDTVDKGVWLRPNGSTPKTGGNTVLVGHRFSYKDPAVFYHLDKVEINDFIAVYVDKKEYVYMVDSIEVVSPDETRVEQQTTDERLTLYTCTPLFTSKNRLVITAKRVQTTIQKVGLYE